MIVMKFGGSSLEDSAALERVAAIVASRAKRAPLVVVSAMGKTTDRLLEIGRTAAGGDRTRALQLLDELRAYHVEHARAVAPAKDLNALKEFVDEHFHELDALVKGLVVMGELTPRSIDAISSFGERLSSYVVMLAIRSAGVEAQRVDSREVVVTNDAHTAAEPVLEETQKRLETSVSPLLGADKAVVMGGFIASTLAGVTSTLGRGGSDYTASLVGAALGADEVEIWTDVDGVMTADPSLVEDAHRIRVLSFAEASELAYFGARVLHPSTMRPAVEKDIPIRVLNSRRPETEGTLIVEQTPESTSVVKSIAYKENITVVDIRSTRMLMAHGFLAHVFKTFETFETAVDMVTTSEVSVSLTVDKPGRLPEIIREIEEQEVAEVSRRNGQAIVCVVGEGIRHTNGISARIFSALTDIHIAMISLGASRLNVSFVVDEGDLDEVVRRLHAEFFAEIDPSVFG